MDLAQARSQHAGYVAALERLGVDVVALPADDAHPDAVFVQDRVAVVDGKAFVAPSAVAERRGEAEPLVEHLRRDLPVVALEPPAFLDWGDVLFAGDAVYVGLSERSTRAAVERLAQLLDGRRVEPVPLPGDLLHLLSGCAPLPDGTILAVASLRPWAEDRGLRTLAVPAGEEAAANVLSIGGAVLVPAGYPRTAEAIRRRGFEVVAVPASEFEKRDGGLTCLSVVY